MLVGSAGRLLSANHCDESANYAVTDGAGQTIASGGASVAGIGNIDSQLIEAKADGSAPLIAGGDSGGPVFANVTGGVQARGVILAGSAEVACGATNPDVDGECYNYAYYAPISVVLDTWGVQLEVG